MARARLLKPSFFTNDALGDEEPVARLLFAGLWCLADREGRLHDRPRRIKAEVLPYDEVDVNRLLDELAARSLIVRHEAAARQAALEYERLGRSEAAAHVRAELDVVMRYIDS